MTARAGHANDGQGWRIAFSATLVALVPLAVWQGCGSDDASSTSGATADGGASGTPSAGPTSGPGPGGASGQGGDASGQGGDATASGSSAEGGSSASGAAGAGTAGGGGMGGCGNVDYLGTCQGEVLVWCEAGELKTHDCAADGKTCGFQDAQVGYNCLATGGGFGYPVGDGTSDPAGGWTVTQVLGHYLNSGGFVGGHLAEDIANGEAATANAPVYAVADGVVLYAGPNSSTYVNVVLIQHDLGGGQSICSFYGHLGSVAVSEGQVVQRGDQVASVLDWVAQFGEANSHLHYVLLSQDLCNASDAAGGALVCGYDNTSGPNGITDLSNEPATYTSIGDVCGDQSYPDAFIAPSQFIAAHHF